MKKRINTILIAFAIIAALLSGCGGAPAPEPTPEPTPDTTPVASTEVALEDKGTGTDENEAVADPTAKPQQTTPAPTVKPVQMPSPIKPDPTPVVITPAPATPVPTPTPTPTPTPASKMSAAEVGEKMLSALPETGNLMAMPEEYYEGVYQINPSNYDSVCVYGAMINVKANEVIVIKAKDASGVEQAKADLKARLSALEETWKRYLPDQYELVKAGKIVTDGVYAALVVAEGAQSAVDAFYSAI